MKENIDLVAKAFSLLSNWGNTDEQIKVDNEVPSKLKQLCPGYTEGEIYNAVESARKLRDAANLGGTRLYDEPMTSIYEKLRPFLVERVPGLSQKAYEMAARRIMFLYMH